MLALMLIFVGCDVNDNDNSGQARMTVQLTDAPAEYDAVYIDIQSVQVNPEDPTDGNGENGEGDEGWITINDEPMRVNLLELRNGDTIQIGDEALETGTYNQIRLVLGPENEVVIDGQSYALTTPSSQQSGLKLNIGAELNEGEIYNLLIDFDAGRSIVQTGNGKYILKPVLRAVQLEETGSISGMVEPADVQTSVMAIAGDDTLSTLTGEDGNFAILGVTANTYDVHFSPVSDTSSYSDTTVVDVSVDIDEEVDMGTIILTKE